MNKMLQTSLMSLAVVSLLAFSGCGNDDTKSESNVSYDTEINVSNTVIEGQRAALAAHITADTVAQSPRDIDSKNGENNVSTTHVDSHSSMYLCDIHFHKSAEHKGGEFTTYAGNGNGEGFGTGYKYDGNLTQAELAPYKIETEENSLYSGDTIETHYVYSSNPKAELGLGLGTCLAGMDANATQPLLRVEAEVYVLVNDENALDFTALNKVSTVKDSNGTSHYQADGIPDNNVTGVPVEYDGSTTGPGYNEEPSPYQVSWSVHPKVAKVNIKTVKEWFENNKFAQEHAHGVRNLVVNPKLLSPIK